MCVNCNDNINAVVVYSGPAGPQGDPAIMTAASVTSNTIASLGSKTFTLTPSVLNLGWTVLTRIRVSAIGNVAFMEGLITAVSSSSVTITSDYSFGSGTYASWTLSITGAIGINGTNGANGTNGTNGTNGLNGINAYTKTSVIAAGPVNEYIITVSTSTLWMSVGQVLYIENCGYFQVLSFSPTAIVQVLDLLYPGNNPGNLVPNLNISPGGIAGLSQITGTYSPVLTDAVPTVIASTNTGFFVEQGQLVHVEINVDFPASGFGNGTIYSLTLPAGKNPIRSNQYLCGSIYNGTLGDYYTLKARLIANTNKFELYTIRQSTTTDYPFDSTTPFTVNTNTVLYLSFTYEKSA